ncbi:MAG TPA: condensation domain-containing protein, partial [Kofleriaceae bacterium]
APRDPIEETLAQIWRELLGVERVGIRDDFFALGGHSLLATRVASRIRTLLAVELPVRTIFEAPTIEGLAARLAVARGTTAPIQPTLRTERMPLSHAQQRMWLLHQLEPKSTAYNMSSVRWIRGPLDPESLRAAFEDLVHRHEALRTTFPSFDGEPTIELYSPSAWQLAVEDGTALDRAGLARLVDDEINRPFDLATGPLVRTRLIRTRDAYLFIIALHHIVTDGWSTSVLWNELEELYAARVQQRAPALAPLAIQYVDYAVWQRERLAGPELERQLHYWTEQLRGAPTETTLPLKGPRPARPSHRDRRVVTRLSRDLSDQLQLLAQREGATLFMTLLAALRALLARYTGQADLVIGTPIAGRNRRELEGLIGFFVSTLALRTEVRAEDRFVSLLAREKSVALAAYDHQETPFELVVDALQLERRLELNPLFQVWFAHQNIPRAGGTLGEDATDLASDTVSSKFDLALYSSVHDGELELVWHYKPELFDSSTIAKLVEHFKTLLSEVVANPDIRVNALLAQPTVTPLVSSPPTTIWDRFTAVAEERAAHIAIREAEREWTYAMLRERADAIGARLDEVGERVACLLSHGGAMVAGILGVLASGRAYVPLDASHPEARSAFVLEDSGANAILCDATTAALAKQLSGGRPVIRVDEALGGQRPRQRPRPDSLAYCLYTSGSTGRPKGVLQQHSHVVHFIDAYCRHLAIAPTDVLSLLSTFAFDAAVVDVFSALLSGATLAPYDLRRESLAGLAATLVRRGITIYHSTPTVFRALLQNVAHISPLVRAVALGGEEVRADDVHRFRVAFSPKAFLVNGYGMTECSWALLNTVHRNDSNTRPSVPLGAAIEGVHVTLQTPLGPQVAPYGVGTIQITSPNVARGYWHRPDETRTSFPAPNTYVTSDRGRQLPDGRIEFAGRHASQIKLRGMRIDLREIEGVLADHPDIGRSAVVLHDGPRGEEIVAYVVGASAPPSSSAIRDYLSSKLPDYMIPAIVVPLAVLPVGATGKLDRAALPSPDQFIEQATFIAPRTPTELALVDIWTALLRVARIGINDDFFDLGGNSLMVMRLLSRIRSTFDIELPMHAIFESSTLEQLAALIKSSQKSEAPIEIIVPHARGAYPQLSFAQQRMWFLQQLEPESVAYQLGFTRRFEGLDIEILRRAIEALVDRHESLRTTFPTHDGEPYQNVHPPGPWTLDIVDARSLDQGTALREAEVSVRASFDLATGPLFRTKVVRITDDTFVLFVGLHHIITDGGSYAIFWRDLWAFYDAIVAGAPAALPALSVQYADYAAWQRRWIT